MAHLCTMRWTRSSSSSSSSSIVVLPLILTVLFALLEINSTVGAHTGSAAAASGAAASNGRDGRAQAVSAAAAQFSAATAAAATQRPPFFQPPPPPPPVEPVAFAPLPPTVPRKRQRQINALLARLEKIESGPSFTLAECQRWADLNDRYIKLAGIYRKVRAGETFKLQQCRALGFDQDDIFNKIQNFRSALLEETDQLEIASNLISDYVDIRVAAAGDVAVANELDGLRANDPQFNYAVDRLDSFIKFIESKTEQLRNNEESPIVVAAVAASRAGLPPNPDDIEDIHKAIKQLIDREATLSDEESDQLIELGDILERYLNDGVTVDPQSGRWRYLFGALEASRGVVLRKVRGEEPLPPPPPPAYDDGAAYAASYANANGGNWASSAGAGAGAVASNGRRAAAAAGAAATANRAGGSAAAASSAAATNSRPPPPPRYDQREYEAAEAEAEALAEANDAARANAARARAAAKAKRLQAQSAAAAVASASATGAARPAPAPPAKLVHTAASSAASAQGGRPFPPRRIFADYNAARAAAGART